MVGADADLESAAAGLARDVALFDQRGCLSVHAVYLETPVYAPAKGPPETLCTLLAQELEAQAAICPAGPLDPAVAAGVQQLRVEARMRGLFQPSLAVDVGTVILEPETRFRPSPGARTVRVHALNDLKALPGLLRPWRDSLQGVALAGDTAWGLRRELTDLGVSRFASPGELQTPDALWHNGGIHPLAVLAPAGPT